MAEAAAGIGILGGAGLSAVGAIRQGNMEAKAAEMNAQMNEQNAVLTEAQAREEERRQRIFARKQIGEMRANYGASGVTTEGSPMEVLEESAMQAELDSLNIRYAGAARSAQYRNQAKLQRFYGKEAKLGGYLSAAGSLLGGAGSFVGMKRT